MMNMSTSEPIRSIEQIELLADYYLAKHNYRNYALIVSGLHTALRISDLLSLKWGNVYNVRSGVMKEYLTLTEQKTGKKNKIRLNTKIVQALTKFKNNIGEVNEDSYIFKSQKGGNTPITRVQAYKIIKKAVNELSLQGNVSCHSLRKTFGYWAWKSGVQVPVIMDIYNHSSFDITKRYLCISQEDKDDVFNNVKY